MNSVVLILLVLSVLFPNQLFAQAPKPTTISELVTYNGKDREQVLYAGAKSEGKVTWYTSLAGDSYKAMVKAFEGKYSGVKVEAYRVSGSDMTVRMMEEAKAKRHIVDAVETTEGNLYVHARRFSVASLPFAVFCFLPGRRQRER
jgi:ABC-type glycerol-3-phosphate transport system substrate-binding protein